jgi:nucleolar protein 4
MYNYIYEKLTDETLRKEMEKYGSVQQLSIPLKDDGKMKGFGFVQFSNLEEAKKALDDLNSSSKKLAGNKVSVDWCIPKNIFIRFQTDSKKGEEGQGEENDSKPVDKKKTTKRQPSSENEDDDEDQDDDEDDSEDEEEQEEEEEDEPPKKKQNTQNEKKNKFEIKAKSGTQDVVEQRTVFLRNLAFDSTEDSIIEAFSKFGPIKYAKICMDRELERPRGTGFIQFETSEAAANACSESNILELDFRKIQVDMAVPRNKVTELVEKKKNDESAPKDKRFLFSLLFFFLSLDLN